MLTLGAALASATGCRTITAGAHSGGDRQPLEAAGTTEEPVSAAGEAPGGRELDHAAGDWTALGDKATASVPDDTGIRVAARRQGDTRAALRVQVGPAGDDAPEREVAGGARRRHQGDAV